jgi:outer membrane protein TolC
LTLSLADAVQRGLAHNLAVLLEEQRVQSAEGARWRALSGLLPEVSGSLSATREKINLAAFGFTAPESLKSWGRSTSTMFGPGYRSRFSI